MSAFGEESGPNYPARGEVCPFGTRYNGGRLPPEIPSEGNAITFLGGDR